MVVSRADPAHEAPPLEGAGLLQDRVLTRLPTPHDAEQALQTPKSPQLPLTERILKNKINLSHV